MVRKKNDENSDESPNLDRLSKSILNELSNEFVRVGRVPLKIDIRIEGNRLKISSNAGNGQIGKQKYANAGVPVEIIKESGCFVVLMELEAVRREHIKVVAERQIVHIGAEGMFKKYSERVNLDRCVDPSMASARYTNNVLEIRLPYSNGKSVGAQTINVN